jgi:hypothetical protein
MHSNPPRQQKRRVPGKTDAQRFAIIYLGWVDLISKSCNTSALAAQAAS